MKRLVLTGVLAVVLLAACGRLNRAATINQVTHTAGAATETALQQQLAKQGLTSARVTCAKQMIVNVGTRTSCVLTGAGAKSIVRFTFSSSDGAIDPASVKVS